MGFFTGLGNAAREVNLNMKYGDKHGGDKVDVYRDPKVGGLSNFPGVMSYPETAFREGLERYDQGYTGPITAKVRDLYGLNTAEAGYLAKGMPIKKDVNNRVNYPGQDYTGIRNDRVVKKARQNKANPKAAEVQRNMEMRAAMDGPPQVAGVRYTDVPIPQRGGGQFQAGAETKELLLARNNINNAMERAPMAPVPVKSSYKPDTLAQQFEAFYNSSPIPPRGGGQFQLGGTDPGNIPGIGAVNIKMHSPTQAEQVLAGMGTSPVQLSDLKAGQLEEKGFRNAIAAEKVRIAQGMLGESGKPADFFDAIDALNAADGGEGPVMREAMANSPAIANLIERQDQGGFKRGTESPDFVGEGMFGRVDRIAPGYVEKRQPAVAEWFKGDGEGGSIPVLYDARDVASEVNDLNQLQKLGITPKVEAFNINPDGSTEVVMKDLTQNFEPGDQVLERVVGELENAIRPKERRMAGDELRRLAIARRQQEGMAAVKGIELQDRHEGNFMVNKFSGRPIQIDPSGRAVEGFDRDAVIASKAVGAMQGAGLAEEAGILDGLLREAMANEDPAMFKDLAQQGFSRAMKLKRGIDQDYFVANSAMVMPE